MCLFDMILLRSSNMLRPVNQVCILTLNSIQLPHQIQCKRIYCSRWFNQHHHFPLHETVLFISKLNCYNERLISKCFMDGVS